jgi:Protein of unknown function (DUF3616)
MIAVASGIRPGSQYRLRRTSEQTREDLVRPEYLASIVGLLIFHCGGARALEAGPAVIYDGPCEPSAVVAYPEGTVDKWFIVADDNDNILRVYEAPTGRRLEEADLDLNDVFGLDPEEENDKIDIEAATWLGGTAYFIGSHSRSGKEGKVRPSRSTLFAITARMDGEAVTLTAPSSRYRDLRRDLSDLSDTLAGAISLDVEENDSLTPGKRGFNIEGMSVTADGTSLLLGLRNPLVKGKAMLVLFDNPQAVLSAGAKPVLHVFPALDLREDGTGKGIRSIEYVPAKKMYLILSGPSDDGGGFAAWWWSLEDNRLEPVDAINRFLDADDQFRAEAVLSDATGEKIVLFSDNDDVCDKDNQRFRGVMFQ